MDARTAEPLARFPALRTCDAGEAEQVVSRAYVPHRLRAPGAVDARLNLSDSNRLTFGYLTYGSDIELLVPPMLDCYHLNLTVCGHTAVRHGKARTVTAAGAGGVVLSPREDSTLEWSADATQFAVKIPLLTMQAHLSSLLHEPVEAPLFDLHVDLTSDSGKGLLGAASFLADQLGNGDPGELVREQLESYLLTQLLLGAEHSYSRRLRGGGASGRFVLGEAVDYIEAYPERALGIAELAAVAGTTAAALQAAFEQELGQRAEDYVRGVRLARAHSQLRDRRPGDSVESIARRWGFRSVHRFRAEYQARYGGSPGTAGASPRSGMAHGG
jgi:AraC-like DNA-binding protein